MAVEWGNYRPVPICRYAQLARTRQLEDLERAAAHDPDFPYYYDEEEADRAVWFFSELVQFDGEWAGLPFSLSDWQEWDIIRPLFGWKKTSDGTRRFRSAYIEIPRKNGKTTLMAGIAGFLLLADREPGAQIYCAATKEDQAKLLFDAARKLLENSPSFCEEFQAFKKSLYCPQMGSVFRPLGRDSKTQDGFSVHGGLIDEYHAHPSSDIKDVLASGRGARRQPLICTITTAGFNTFAPCKRESDLAKTILEGTVSNETYFAYVTTVDDPKNWADPIEWQKANPNLGISVYEEGFREDFKEANLLPENLNNFLVKKLNIWVTQHEKWLDLEAWKQCRQEIEIESLLGKPCVGGLDLSTTTDLTVFLLLFYQENPKVVLPFFFLPKDSIRKRSERDRVPYDLFERDGSLFVTEGNVVDYDFVEAKILECKEKYAVSEIAFDRWNASQTVNNLTAKNVPMVPFGQGFFSMNAPSKELEKLVLERKLNHLGHPVLEWMAGNVAVAKDPAGNIKPAKDKSSERIDGIVALVMALGIAAKQKPAANFIYNSRGIFSG